MRMIKREKRSISPGEYIKYFICSSADGATSVSGVASRAYHPDELKASERKLIIDVKYYLENQVLPPILRLCDPIQGIQASPVAISLELDGRRFEKRDDELDGYNNYPVLGPHSAAQKFSDVNPLMIA
ncbi:DNA polymerase alpha catalytic subunit [Gracilaria domingensis]|nr:DNA polymerase alpha catalytic subunit [Gracilaria domingensis]